jgi:hypothetical protein
LANQKWKNWIWLHEGRKELFLWTIFL